MKEELCDVSLVSQREQDMPKTYNIYCDESCHLENDGQKIMVLGAVWCPLEKSQEIMHCLREIKQRHGLKPKFEIKWTKVSMGKIDLYLDFVNYFFANQDLHFRALIAEKINLRHDDFGQSHDDWYYKMYFDMLKVLFSPDSKYRLYLDIKGSRGGVKIAKLHEVLCNNLYDFSRSIIERVQIIRSHETEILQLTDLLIGAISYVNRNLSNNIGKVALVNKIKELSHYSLVRTTLYRENKVNIFRWTPSETRG
jgi:hypothetical protein